MNNSKKYIVMRMQRFSHKLYKKKVPVFPRAIFILTRLLCGCSIPPAVALGEGSRLAHNGLGVVIHDKCVIGKGCVIQANVVLGGKNGEGGPHIGDYCYIGAGAVVIGEVEIGNDVVIGANAVVTHSIPSGVVVVGIPGKVIKRVDDSLIGIEKS